MIFQEGVKISAELANYIEGLKKNNRAVLAVIDENSEFLGELDQLLQHNHQYFQHSIEMVAMVCGIREELKEKMGLLDHELTVLSSATLLHDVGKIKIVNEILNKNGELERAEEEEVRKHVQYSYEITHAKNPEAACVLAYHHDFKKKNPYFYEIADAACRENVETYKKLGKILAIVDVLHAFSHKRDYRAEIAPDQYTAKINDELELSAKNNEIVDLLIETERQRIKEEGKKARRQGEIKK